MRRPSLEFDLRASARRGTRASDAPTVSVVVPSTAPRAAVQALIASVTPHCAAAECELLVVRAGTAADAASLGKLVPGARVVHAPPGSDAATLRRVGLSKAAGDVVAFADESRGFEASWLDALARRTAAASPAGAVRLSVIVPACNSAATLSASVAALAASDLPRAAWDLVVVDDASEDDSVFIAAEFADTIVRLPGTPRGPAYARNRGADAARGNVLVFVDAAVAVHRDALGHFAALFASAPDVSAAFGSFDAAPLPRGVLSRYRPLVQHFLHAERGPAAADRFWAGCGAVRATDFRDAGMYDEWRFRRPQVEDVELGDRLRARGRSIVLRPEIQVTSLRRWTLGAIVASEVADQAVPRVRMVSRRGAAEVSGALGPQRGEVANTVLVWLALVALVSAACMRSPHAAAWAGGLALLCVVPFVVINRRLLACFARLGGVGFALAALPLHMLAYAAHGVAVAFGHLLHETVGEPNQDPAVQAFSEVGVKTWPPVPVKRGNG